ncbi:DUF2939 domain-containing protein [Stenotrophomonas sp. STM01]|uniref:DUF2939 domain-containing protein n=1 Tax=Stenotrophomonas sp. STM01 TaxID=2769278 RepID=UPI0017861AC0|nr:DUF2939 domain-containing protein [Stenotrophomonas sp. STM01]MBD9537746.1 DUF2939 domain-containing protein [Stenotrophomonas sp. STM01]
MKKWILPAVILVALALAGYVIGGPYLAIHGISRAIEERDTGRLQRHVDFPALRVNLKAQLSDYMVRKAGPDAQSNLFGAVLLGVASNVTGAGVDTMVTPIGVAALLQGDSLWKRAIGNTANGDTWGPPAPAKPLANTQGHYESLSRFTATTRLEDGREVVFVLSRQGLRWRLTNIQLPLQTP